MVDDMLVGAAGLLPAAAAPRRASFDPTEGDDVNEADLLPVTEGVIEGEAERDEVTEIVGVIEMVEVTDNVGVIETVGVTDAPEDTEIVGVALTAEGVLEGVPDDVGVFEGVPVGEFDDVTEIVGVFEGVAPNDREPVGVGVCEIGVDVAVSEIVGVAVRDSEIVGVTERVGVFDEVGVIEEVGEGACKNVQIRLDPEPEAKKPSAQAHVLSDFQVEFAALQSHPPRTRFAVEPTVHALHTVASFPLASNIEYVLPEHGEQTVFVVGLQAETTTMPSPQVEHKEHSMSWSKSAFPVLYEPRGQVIEG